MVTDAQAAKAFLERPQGPFTAEEWANLKHLYEKPDVAAERERCYARFYETLARRGYYSGSDDGNGDHGEVIG